LIFVAFLFPIAVYLFVLGFVNRRRHPIVLPATWDFVGLLFAASGFLAFGGPAILTSASERWRDLWLVGRLGGANGDATINPTWRIIAGLYFVVIVAGAGITLFLRRSQTAVYNVDTATFTEVLEGVLDSLGLNWSRTADRYYIQETRKGRPASTASTNAIQAAPSPSVVAGEPPRRPAPAVEITGSAYLALDLSPNWHYVTMAWDTNGNDSLREQVESELKRALTEVTTNENPVAVWMLGSSLVLIMLSLSIATIAVVFRIFPH
jgi:hypothetical protein